MSVSFSYRKIDENNLEVTRTEVFIVTRESLLRRKDESTNNIAQLESSKDTFQSDVDDVNFKLGILDG
jgi:hypothetical protein